MLARHLLFIATRRPHNALSAVPSSESIPTHHTVVPQASGPPYVVSPRAEECRREFKDAREEHRQNYPQDLRQDENQKYLESFARVPRTYDDPRSRLDFRRTGNADGRQQFYVPGGECARHNHQQFYTLPTRRPQRELEPPRSATPDITRGLAGGASLSAMHMLARQGQKTRPALRQNDRNNWFESPSNALIGQCQRQTAPVLVDARNRMATPLSLSAVGYRFFATSPLTESISPIQHGSAENRHRQQQQQHQQLGFTASTPTEKTPTTGIGQQQQQQHVDRLTGVSTSATAALAPPHNSNRNAPNTLPLMLSPTRSTMSNEELFAAIHKSKKRLCIKDDRENSQPLSMVNSPLAKASPGSRHSWSPESQKYPEETTQQRLTSSPSSATSRLDFKRLLLQQSAKTGPTRLSATEQLKLSRRPKNQRQDQSPTTSNAGSPLTSPALAKILSPRSAGWRFQTPRTDVLSSTIIEDAAAEEKAMKPSPESASPVPRRTSRKQLDLHFENEAMNKVNEKENSSIENLSSTKGTEPKSTDPLRVLSEDGTRITTFEKLRSPLGSESTRQVGPSTAVSAFESRRISNQLARAQFLAGTPTTSQERGQGTYYVKKTYHQRARSESPRQHNVNIVTNVAVRSPSAPTLETAL